MKVLFSALLLSFSITCFGQVQLLKDLFPANENPPTAGSYPFNFYAQNDKLFFTATTKELGMGLYVSDGTEAGTTRLMDTGGADWFFSALGEKTVFLRSTNSISEIWITDATVAGTTKLKDLTGFCNLIGAANGVVVCSSYSLENGMQLWRTDGTLEGTGLLIETGQDRVYDRAPLNNSTGSYLFFSVAKPAGQYDLWKTDGTTAGTSLLQPFSSYITPFRVEGNEFYFGHQSNQFWKTDGTGAGTIQITVNIPLTPGFTGFDFGHTVSFNGNMLGVAYFDNFIYQYYVYDGSSGDISFLDINPSGAARSLNDVSMPVAFKGNAYFIADDGVHGLKLWKSDGTPLGTQQVTGLGLPDTYARAVYASNEHIWVALGGNTSAGGLTYETWVSDGSGAFIKVLKSESYNAAIVGNGDLYCDANDFIHGNELMKSDGTVAGTSLVIDIEKTPFAESLYLFGTDDKLFFSNTGQAGGISVGASDGTADGTAIIKEFNDYTPSRYYSAAAKGDRMIFTASDEGHGAEPWITDGTLAGTVMLADTEPGSESSYINLQGYTWVGDKAFFFSTLAELWVTDGTPAGTTSLRQFSDPLENNLYNISFQGSYYFIYKESLWKSDGTPAGTAKIKSLVPEGSDPFTTGILSGTNKFYFMLDDMTHGLELWVSDGTEAGTFMIKDIHTSGSAFSFFFPLAVINDIAYFSSGVDDNDDLWRSDGTPEGTYMVKDININEPSTINPLQHYNVATLVDGNVFYFAANDGTHGSELWRSDGTEAGTFLVKDINPGEASSYPSNSTEKAIDGRIVFFADDGVHGREPWRSNGTEERTILVQDLNPGEKGSMPTDNVNASIVTIYNDKVFFIADVPGTGSEQIWWHDPSALLSQTVFMDNIPNKKFLDPSFSLNATSSSGLPITFSVTSGPATISGATLTITGGGQVTVKATQGGNDDFEAAFANQTFTVSKAGQTVTFDAIADKRSDDAPFNLTASSSSSLPITFSITSGPATISGSTLTITGAGTVVVKATQAGNDNYNPASKELTFIVELVLGLEDADQLVIISPNPATSTLLIQAPPAFRSFSLKDMLGRDAISMPITNETTTVDVGQLSRGMYIVKLVGADQNIVTRKIVLR